MRSLAYLILLAACSANHAAHKPDTDAGQIDKDWRWALGQFGSGACAWLDRCGSSSFQIEFGSGSAGQAACVQYYEAQCDIALGVAMCDAPYPQSLLPDIEQCVTDWSTYPCDEDCDPASCFTALSLPVE